MGGKVKYCVIYTGYQRCAALWMKRHPSAWSNTVLAVSYCWQFCQGISLLDKTCCKYNTMKRGGSGVSE